VSSSIRGTVLAGRYRLEERIHTNPDGALWRAVDSTLDRQVSVRVMRPNHPFAADVADAARRAALIDDIRLVRVLDVGSDGEVGYVVSEYVDGDSLATLVERSPLSPPAVRRIIGEVAQGLDGAAERGLHHLRLTPRSVIVCRDGAVKISGTAVEAAAAGLEPDHAATASRVDAVSLVALLYSGLTGRWPLGDAGFPPAPRGEGGGPVPPADLVPGVPNDLDTLCVVTLGSVDDGPRSPAELVQELAPWPSAAEAPLRAPTRRLPIEPPANSGPAGGAANRPFGTKRPAAKHPSSPSRPGAPPVRPAPEPYPSTAELAAQLPAPENLFADRSAPAAAAANEEQAIWPGATSQRPATGFIPLALNAPGPSSSDGLTEGASRLDSLFSPQVAPVPPAPTPGGGMPRGGTPGRGTARGETPGRGVPQGGTPGRGVPRTGTPSRGVPRTGTPSRGVPRRAVPDRSDDHHTPSEPLSLWGAGWPTDSGPPSPLESTGPFPIIIPPEAPPREQSRLVIVSVGAVLLLVLLVAGFSLRNFGSSDNVAPSDSIKPLPTASGAVITSAPSPSVVEPTSPATTAPPTAGAPVQVSSIRAIDPQGDGDEDTPHSRLAIDGDPSTSWKSDTYRNSSFSGLKKGVGLALKLKSSAVVQSATISISGFGGAVELRTADGPDLASSKLVGKASLKNGEVTVRADNASPSKYVILWFTKLPSVGGKYKLQISEVQLK
jgi:hypothetical protein